MSETWPYPRLYWTADRTRLVGEGDPRAAFLAWNGYAPVPADQLALVDAGESKHIPAPPEDKMVRSRATKSSRR